MKHKSIHLEEAENGYVVSMYQEGKEGMPGKEMRTVHKTMEEAIGSMKSMMMGKGEKAYEQMKAIEKRK